MRILHVLDHSAPKQTQYSARTIAILKQQKELGYDTLQLTGIRQGPSKVFEEEIDGLVFHRTPLPVHLRTLPFLKQVQEISCLRKRVEEIVDHLRPSVIHVHSPVENAIAALPVARKYHIPLVYEVRSLSEDLDEQGHKRSKMAVYSNKRLETYVLKRAQAITTVCEGLKNEIVTRGISRKKITVVPNGVDIKQFSYNLNKTAESEEIRTKHWLVGKTVLGFIGSLDRIEGLSYLIKAFALIKKAIPNAKILIVGGGPDLKNLKSLVHTMQLTDDVIFAGRIPNEQLHHYVDVIDYFVYPRIRQRLTDLVAPSKPLEAMARGKCVIASDVGGHKELIQDGVNGILFRASNSKSLAKVVIETVLKQKDEIVVPAARAFVEKQRNWQTATAHYEKVYDTILSD